jgi:hypothetical protein
MERPVMAKPFPQHRITEAMRRKAREDLKRGTWRPETRDRFPGAPEIKLTTENRHSHRDAMLKAIEDAVPAELDELEDLE